VVDVERAIRCGLLVVLQNALAQLLESTEQPGTKERLGQACADTAIKQSVAIGKALMNSYVESSPGVLSLWSKKHCAMARMMLP
jgi:hypothetical protein